MPYCQIRYNFSNVGSRNDVRSKVVNYFLMELPGNGQGADASRYDYLVANLIAGNNVILTRPANKKNGFDFLIRVSNINFNPSGRARDYPKHEEILQDLSIKKYTNTTLYSQLRGYIDEIYNCNIEVESINFNNLNFNIGFDIDLLLHCIKWFFIEQDIRYWNYSGRAMLYNGILSI